MSINSLVTRLLGPNLTPNFWQQTSWAILKAVVGIMMIHNGIDKLANAA